MTKIDNMIAKKKSTSDVLVTQQDEKKKLMSNKIPCRYLGSRNI